MYVGEFGQRQRHHLHRGIQLHGARAERYHAVGKRNISSFEAFDVAHHLRLAVVLVEYGSVEYLIRPQQGTVNRHLALVHLDALGSLLSGCLGEYGNHLRHLVGRSHLVETHPHGALVRIEEVDIPCQRGILHHRGLRLHLQGIEIVPCRNFVAEFPQSVRYRCGMRMDMLRNPTQPFGSVIDRIESRHGGHEGGCGTDIGRSLLAFDVLLARLECHSQRLVPQPVHRYADDTARHVALVGLLGGHETGRRAAEAHRQTEALGGTHRDVGTPLSRRSEQYKAHQVAHGGHLRTGLVSGGGKCRIVADMARCGRILHDGAELLAGKLVSIVVVSNYLDAERLAARHEYIEHLREDVVVHEELVATVLYLVARTQGEHHEHRLSGGARIIQQRAVAYLHAGERNGHRLEVQERFEAALGNLGLVRGIGGVPCGILEHVAHDNGGSGRRVPAHTDERTHLSVLGGQLTHMSRELVFGHSLCGQSDGFAQADGCRNHLSYQLVHTGDADDCEHLLQVGFRHAYMAVSEFIERHNPDYILKFSIVFPWQVSNSLQI